MEKLITEVHSEGSTTSLEAKQDPWSPQDSLDVSSHQRKLKESSTRMGRQRSSSPPDGLNRFIGGGFWRTLTNEVESLRQAIDNDDDEEDSDQEPEDRLMTDSQKERSVNIFGLAFNTAQNLRALHPRSQHVTRLSEIYVTNIDTCNKIIHVPNFQIFISSVISNFNNIPSGNYVEPFLFSIYYAAVTSLTDEQCISEFQDDREYLLSKYRAGIERGLCNADFLRTRELGVLQALYIFILTVRCNDGSQLCWTLLATLVRLAQGLGLDRESMSAGLSPLVVELRRRLWWEIVVLDTRAQADRGGQALLSAKSFSTTPPLIINDCDINSETISLPTEPQEFTQMTKFVVSLEVCRVHWRLGENPDFTGPNDTDARLPFAERLKVLTDLEENMNKRIIRFCDLEEPFQWVTATICRCVMLRIRLMLYRPFDSNQSRVKDTSVSQGYISNDELLETASACMEYNHLLDTDPRAAPWRWHYKTYTQWHALAVVLAELCLQTRGPMVQRAWRIVDAVFDSWAARIADSPNGMLWRPMKKLMAKAQAKRLETHRLDDKMSDKPKQQHPLPQFDLLNVEPRKPDMAGLDEGLSGTLSVAEMIQDPITAHAPSDIGSNNGLVNDIGLTQEMGTNFTDAAGSTVHDGVLRNGVGSENEASNLPGASVTGLEESGGINWAEWDEFMSGFDMKEEGFSQDIDMPNASSTHKSQEWW